ncbi:calcium-binding EF-hand domain-containing protein (plasmid) [Rhizobium etli]|uniref:Calcium-binding EF-hand domain-containing protein n=1 Tax=Rhizobium etli TaxID=29449 RepID=A0AAN1ENC2_RHIET|nr:EF-hand domain-containing protein [Rhizobium etli]ARQ13904.1 calcium-binding EF-hand domain-containing protein [Rhizobium etli]
MTTISAATSVSSYSYSKSSTSASQDVLSCSTVSAKKSTTSGQLNEDTSSSADKLMAQLMTLAMNRFDRSGSTGEGDGGAGMDVADLDSDGDGYVSKAEFVAARPSDFSEDQAGTLFDSLDSEGAGSLSVDSLAEAMSAQRSERPDGPPPPGDDDQFASLLSDLDTNGDGVVSLDEFLAGMHDVTESQASQLFDLLDTSGTGSLSTRSAA